MDVRQLDFLARQPSASLVERSRFWGMPKREIALILANALLWQPLLAQADGIAVSGTTRTRLGQAGNGVPIINIAAPNASGLSHNQYQQYNVGTQGVILNNATDRTQSTQLGGIILGNQNLNGHAASTILNEVLAANASQLNGYTEVAGQSARVIVANPYGISCNGCGFINTPQVTLTTGQPMLDNGRLDHLRVDGGSVSIDGTGLNADNVDQFDIITRSAKINAELHAKKLNIITGRNDVDAQTLNATTLADNGSAQPQLAIDSSALGGMYAGAIRLVGTEAGVGVRLAGNLAASAGDIQIDANGQLSMAQVAANGAVNVEATNFEVQSAIYGNSVDVHTRETLSIQQDIAARDSISLSSDGQLTNNAIVEAGVNADNSRNASGDVSLSAQSLRNNGTVIASRDLTAKVTQNLDNSGHQLVADRNQNLTVNGALNNQSGTLGAGQSLQVNAGRVDNRQGSLVSDDGNLSVSVADVFDNKSEGSVQAGGAATVNAQTFDNQGGLLSAVGLLQMQVGIVFNSTGRIASKTDLIANIGTLTQQGGELVSEGTLNLTGHALDNRNGGLIGATKALTVNVGNIDNRGGEISSQVGVNVEGLRLNNGDSGKILSQKTLALNVDQVLNQNEGLLSGKTGVSVVGSDFDNTSGTVDSLQSIDVDLGGILQNNVGLFSSEGTLGVRVGALQNNAGSLSSGVPH